ncbi:MAG: 16S rRNA (uracil1498-N3)-methyltransferase [Kiritimatiellia bacterium]
MNIILFEPDEVDAPLARGDLRARHILKVLRAKVGDSIDVGIVDGSMGTAVLEAIGAKTLSLRFEWGAVGPPLHPVDLIVGLSRPRTCQKILNEATTLGVRSLRFVRTELGERSYAQSKLWTSGDWRRHVVAGASQACSTRIPLVKFDLPLRQALSEVPADATTVALHNHGVTDSLASVPMNTGAVVLAIGSERGWTPDEVEVLREHGFGLVGLGRRVLRTETAVISALSITLSRAYWD